MRQTLKSKRTPAHLHPHYHRRLLLWLLLFLSAVLLFILVCSSQKSSYVQTAASPSVTYSGTTPCADCEGIKTTLTLNSDPDTYSLTLVYLGRTAEPFVEDGTWNTSTISGKTVYTTIPNNPDSTKTMYQVVNGTQIRQLDGDGNAIPDSLPFTLTKTN